LTRQRQALRQADHRVSSRIKLGAPTSVKWGVEQLSGMVESINLAGLYVTTPRVPDLGEYVDLVFALPQDGRNFRVRASVVHTRPLGSRRSGFGARFERAPLGFLEAIRGLTGH
jgi:Tfp pilus assembly protein PilZ